MAIEIARAPDRVPLSHISWAAIFASLAVGISVMLLLTLAGVAVGLTAVDGEDARAITIGAAAWQTISMLIAAIVGGYVAARLSGLRRSADGVLHGAVSWGATTLLYAALATTAIGTLTAGMFGLIAPSQERTATTSTGPTATVDRDQMQRRLEGMGMSAEQSRSIAERLSAPATAGASSAGSPRGERAADAAGAATGWLTATVLVSLVLSMIGGSMGVRGSRRVNRRLEQAAVTSTAPLADAPGRVLSRQT